MVFAYLLDVVIAQSASILKLLSGEDQTLLVRWNSLLVLDLGLHIVDRIARLNLKGNSLTGKRLDEAMDFASVWCRGVAKGGLGDLTSALEGRTN